MAIKIKKALLLFILVNHSISFSQEITNDFGVIISTENNSKLAIEYRKAKNEHFLWKIGLTYYASNSILGDSRIVFASDSLVTERNYFQENLMGGLRFGFDNQIKSSVFYWGGDINVSLFQQKSIFRNNNYLLNEMGFWANQNVNYGENIVHDPNNAYLKEYFLHTSLRGHFSANLSLGKNALLVLSYSASVGLPVLMSEHTKIDPLGEFENRLTHYFDFYSSIGAGIRYQIPKK